MSINKNMILVNLLLIYYNIFIEADNIRSNLNSVNEKNVERNFSNNNPIINSEIRILEIFNESRVNIFFI